MLAQDIRYDIDIKQFKKSSNFTHRMFQPQGPPCRSSELGLADKQRISDWNWSGLSPALSCFLMELALMLLIKLYQLYQSSHFYLFLSGTLSRLSPADQNEDYLV